jgi:protein phosphatase methylesterase 1
LDLSLNTLAADFISVLDQTKTRMGWKEMPSLILIGHSLGGAVVTDVAKGGKLGSSVLGYAVLDVVEGSAIDALQSMQTYLSTRPVGFPSVESGIEWHIRSRTVRNSVSARTSVPSLLVNDDDTKGSRPWTWRTDLAATQPFWEGWFVGLSKKFLEARGGKLLLLAGTDRLDKELTIGQMQGESLPIIFIKPRLISVRKICAASISRGWPFHPRRLARKDSDGHCRLLQTER